MVRQGRAANNLPPSDPRAASLTRAVVFGAQDAVLVDLPQLTEDQPTHRPLVSEVCAGPTSRIDLGNALVVDLLTGTLENVTDLTLFGGANAFAIESAAVHGRSCKRTRRNCWRPAGSG